MQLTTILLLVEGEVRAFANGRHVEKARDEEQNIYLYIRTYIAFLCCYLFSRRMKEIHNLIYEKAVSREISITL